MDLSSLQDEIKAGPKRTLLAISHTVLSGTYFSQLSDFLNNFKSTFSSSFSFLLYKGQGYFYRRSSMNQIMKAGATPSLSYIEHSKCLPWVLCTDNLNTVHEAKSPNVIHILTTKSMPEKNIASTIFIKQEIKEIFSVPDPRTEVQNKAYARSIYQLCCEAFSMHGSTLFNWNYW